MLNNLTIGTKLIGAFLIIIGVIIVVAVAAVLGRTGSVKPVYAPETLVSLNMYSWPE